MRRLAAPALALAAATAAAAAQDWPAFRGPDGSGASPTAAPLTWGAAKNVAWKSDLPGPGSSTPVVVGEHVFVTCYSGYAPGRGGSQAALKLHVVALDRGSGKLLWTRDVAPKLPESDNTRDGHGYASATPAADAARLYTFFGKTGVVAFDHAGQELWRADVGSRINEGGWGSGASVVLAAGKVIVNASIESESLVALDPATGKEAWRLRGVKEAWNTPVPANHGGRAELVMASFGKLFAVDPATGRELWHSATDIPWYMVPSVVVGDGVAYALGGRPGGGLAVKLGGTGDVTRTHRSWTSKKGTNVPSPVLHDGHLYWMHDNQGLAYCAEAKTGRVVYEERVGRSDGSYGSPVLAGGRIYYPGRSGTMYVVAAKPAFELLASNTFGERGDFLSSPAVAGGRLYLRTNRYVCCVGGE